MDKNTARTIADGLTWARIWLALPITVLAWYDFRWWVFGLYIVAALTDLFDGMFARRAAPPKTDVDLDGNADIVFSIMTLIWLWMLIPGFLEKYWLPYLPILLAIQIYVSSAPFRFPGIRVPHFEFGRFMMIVFCCMLPVLLIWGDQPWFVHSVFVLGTIGKLQLAWYVVTYDAPSPVLRKLARLILRLGGWTPVGGLPDSPKAVVIAAPHTSNWDGFWALTYKVAVGLDVRFLAKKSLFWFPLGNLLRWLGAIELDRGRAVNAVQAAIDEFDRNESFYIALAPEGTRGLTPGWKTGFYRIARGANVPVWLGFLDFRNKRIGIGAQIALSGDVDADLAVMREYYSGIVGRWPEQTSPIVFP